MTSLYISEEFIERSKNTNNSEYYDVLRYTRLKDGGTITLEKYPEYKFKVERMKNYGSDLVLRVYADKVIFFPFKRNKVVYTYDFRDYAYIDKTASEWYKLCSNIAERIKNGEK